ncbi:MAG TPA: IS481 family transposase [Micromonosporaceae bacterium]|nr:IS481 family transposase [Micromonosporaceae bacterium]
MRLLDAQLAAGVRLNAAEFAREHGVSVRTVYRHRARVRAEGEWRPRSRRPGTSPTATPADLAAWILKLRDDLGVDNGADHIRDVLVEIHARTGPAWMVPARSTINRVLARHGKLVRNPKKRPRSSWRRFSYARPRDCYQQDGTEVALAGGQKAVVFDVLDDCTRYLVACRAHPAETAEGAIDAAEHAVDEMGAPGLWLTDNGTAFTSRRTHPDNGISTFTRKVLGWSTRLIHSSPYHPQTCGKVERHHQTLKKWLRSQPKPATIEELQRLLDAYREYYNNRRHSALPRRMTPAQAWVAAESLGGPTSPPRQVDATLHRCQVHRNGHIAVGSHRMSVGRANAAATVTVIRDGDRATVYDTDGNPLGHAYLDPAKRYVTFTRKEPVSTT